MHLSVWDQALHKKDQVIIYTSSFFTSIASCLGFVRVLLNIITNGYGMLQWLTIAHFHLLHQQPSPSWYWRYALTLFFFVIPFWLNFSHCQFPTTKQLLRYKANHQLMLCHRATVLYNWRKVLTTFTQVNQNFNLFSSFSRNFRTPSSWFTLLKD